jgi:hypothetical protein
LKVFDEKAAAAYGVTTYRESATPRVEAIRALLRSPNCGASSVANSARLQ